MSATKDDSSDSSGSGHDRMKPIMTGRKPIAKSKIDFISMAPGANKMSLQQHARTRNRCVDLNKDWNSDSSASLTNASLTSSITRFRYDFEDLKCKMRIFGESLNLCRCIASDFEGKLSRMERRLQQLEKRQIRQKTELDYSAIIKKNKELSNRTMHDAKKLQMCGTEEQMRDVAAKICRNYLHGAWKCVEPADLDFKRISGGLSNFLYYVALPDDASRLRAPREDEAPAALPERARSNSWIGDEPKKVLLRIYGQVHGERAMDAIVTESVIFTLLSERRLGPKLHGVFSGGRIEEYIPARPLLTKELSEPALSMKIAEKMAAIHSMEVPLSKEPSWLWKTMAKWNKTIMEERAVSVLTGKREEEVRCINRLKSIDFEREIEWAKKFIANVQSPAVFCHNDMQEGNILMLEDTPPLEDDEHLYSQSFTSQILDRSDLDPQYEDSTRDSLTSLSDSGEPRLVLIDFEYCAYNYRGFDIANHFQEWGYDYTNPEHPFFYEQQENWPTLEQKEIFIRQYLKHYHSNVSEGKHAEPSIDDVNHLLDEVDAFAAISHLLWSMWSIVNAGKSQIPFGYWEYATSRFETYLRLKQEIVKKDRLGPQKRKICEVDI